MASTDTPGRGSFRGVPFLIYQEQRERGGRNIVRREYPLRESGGADDLGPKLPEFTFTALVIGDDLQTQRSRLRDALRAPGAGELMHPDYGTLNVLINSFESRYNASEQGTVEFTINVIPASDDTAPAVAESLAGMFAVLTGLPGDPSLSLTGKAATPSGSLTTNRDSMTEQAMPQLYRTLSSLRYTLSGQDDPQILIGLTPAAQKNIRLLRTVMQSATLVSQAQTVGKLLDQVVRQSATHVQDTDREGGLAWLESSADVQRINRDLSDALEQQVLDLSAQGHTGTALALRDARLALTEDLTTRSVHLPGASLVMVRTTEPALVTLYRATGNSRRWQYFVRRNNIPDPVFVPGGRSVEVISEQQD
ncbi:TPA: DNA circularization protein [Escherichia coli]|nr:DNA circularization protein [Escherichia coli]